MDGTNKTILLIATFDTKQDEALFLKERIESRGFSVLTLDAGILSSPPVSVDINQDEVAARGGKSLKDLLADGDKSACIFNMVRGVEILATELYEQGRFEGVVGIGGGQGTDIGCAAMRSLPTSAFISSAIKDR